MSQARFWRRGLALLLALLLAPLASCTDDARAATLDRISAAARADSLEVSAYFRLLPPVDSARVRIDVSGEVRTRMVPGVATAVHINFTAPVEGQRVRIITQLTSYNDHVASPAVTDTIFHTRPSSAPPPPIIDSVTVEMVEQALGTATPVSPLAVIRWDAALARDDTCHAEWATLVSHGDVVRPAGAMQRWCRESLLTDTMNRTGLAYRNLQAVRYSILLDSLAARRAA